MKLGLDVGEEPCDNIGGVGLVTERKCPRIVGEVVEYDQVILKPGEATNGGGPQITMQ